MVVDRYPRRTVRTRIVLRSCEVRRVSPGSGGTVNQEDQSGGSWVTILCAILGQRGERCGVRSVPRRNFVERRGGAVSARGRYPGAGPCAAPVGTRTLWTDRNGARVVARAWSDPEYRACLLADGTAACAGLGSAGVQGEYIVVLEDTPTHHNVIVCTQCSCVAWPVPGQPRELGLDLPAGTSIRVWDTRAETRYLVLPLRPSGTEGWSEEQLAAIVTREAMIGVAMVRAT